VAPREAKVVVGGAGDLEITTSNISEVCPVDADSSCATARIGGSQDVGVSTAQGVHEAVINPSKSHIVIGTENAVIVVPMITPAPVVPTPTPAETFSAAGSPGATPPASIPPSLTPQPSPSDEATPEPTPAASVSPGESPAESPTEIPVASSSQPPVASPSASPEATPTASPDATPAPPSPSDAATEGGWPDHHRRRRHPRRPIRRLLPRWIVVRLHRPAGRWQPWT
jgi:hypothetical protein